MIARHTGRARTKVGLSDPVVPHGRAIAQRIKATLGITGLSPPRVHIDGEVWHLDVGSSHPGAVVGPKGWAVRPLKWYASWVQNVVRHGEVSKLLQKFFVEICCQDSPKLKRNILIRVSKRKKNLLAFPRRSQCAILKVILR